MKGSEITSLREALVESHSNLLFIETPENSPDKKPSAETGTTDSNPPGSKLTAPRTATLYGYSRLDSSESDTSSPYEVPPTDGHISPAENPHEIVTPPRRRNLTIGVELEAIIDNLTLEDGLEVYRIVADALHPLACELGTGVVYQCGIEPPYAPFINTLFQVIDDLSIETSLKQDSDTETSIPLWEASNSAGIEVITPIMRNDEWTFIVPEMMGVLRRSFDISFNRTTALHVHVGIGRPYTLRDLKRVAKAVILFEDAINTLHPLYRNSRYTLIGSHILPCRKGEHLKGLSDYDMMMALEKTSSIAELIYTINPIPSFMHNVTQTPFPHWKGYRYSFTSIPTLGTIEFRQAAGTLNGEMAVIWIKRIAKFVISAVSTSDDMLESWAKAGIGRTTDAVILEAFGAPVPVDMFSAELEEAEKSVTDLLI
ncbi:putative amidoligase enzyme-domain-containing protein [Morchella snyderi]|nr:putative amidoligase enzyme-domain-containing protein [Morchella snyderi]